MDLDLRLVRYFVTVADELHFGRASTRLYISQPALSKQIRKLESDLGAQLLVRDSRHVALTVRGERFLDDARQLLAIAERMRRAPETDAMRIAHIFELDTSRQVADAFASEFPSVRLVERSMDSARQLDALLSEQLDVAILRVTPQMLAERPDGWQRRLLRLEPTAAGGPTRRRAWRLGLAARATGRGVRGRGGVGTVQRARGVPRGLRAADAGGVALAGQSRDVPELPDGPAART